VIDKPSGLASVGRHLDDPDCAQFHMIEWARRMVWACHQLDADTSGVLVLVRRKSLVPVMQERMRWPNAAKTYLAVIHGRPSFESLRIDAAIGPLDRAGRHLGVTPKGKAAASRVQVLARAAEFSLVAVTLETGRTHQVRIHLNHVGHPLVGEPWYAAVPCERLPRHALHAARIDFFDEHQPRQLVAPLPADLLDFCELVGLPRVEGVAPVDTD
jgi:23S rRNA-/tRNA-specific pseudouridylate synthase